MSPHTGVSRHLANTPTGSHPQEPGPYHKANALLRHQLPHYNVDVTVRTRWDHIALWMLAVVIWFVYIAVRVMYLIRGRTGPLSTTVVSRERMHIQVPSDGGILSLLGQFFGYQIEQPRPIVELCVAHPSCDATYCCHVQRCSTVGTTNIVAGEQNCWVLEVYFLGI